MNSIQRAAHQWTVVAPLVILAMLIMALGPAWPAAAQEPADVAESDVTASAVAFNAIQVAKRFWSHRGDLAFTAQLRNPTIAVFGRSTASTDLRQKQHARLSVPVRALRRFDPLGDFPNHWRIGRRNANLRHHTRQAARNQTGHSRQRHEPRPSAPANRCPL